MYDEVRESVESCLKHMGCNDRTTINDVLCSIKSSNAVDSLNDTWYRWFDENYNNPYIEMWPEFVKRKKSVVPNNRPKNDPRHLTEFSLMVASFSMV